MPSTKQSRRAARPATWNPLPAVLVHTLLALYYPFVALVVALTAAAAGGLVVAACLNPYLAPFVALPVAAFTVTLVQLLWALRVVFWRVKDVDDEMELRVPRDMAPRLYEWVEEIAEGRGLPALEDIRVAADTVAHVYERAGGRPVLVLGAVAVRALPEPVLAGIVAHELGHLGAGDTALLRRAARRHRLMGHLEFAFQFGRNALLRRRGLWSAWRSLVTLGVIFNPAVWGLRLYHLAYALARAAHSRECEYAADRMELAESGAEAAAQALVLLTVAERMPWTRLSSLAESWVATNQPVHLLFEEQARAARSLGPHEWEDALRKELKRPTGVFDSHPGLKPRLAALGVSPKKALRLTPQLSGPPASELFGRWWPKLEQQLADRLLVHFREAHLAKMHVGELFGALRSLEERGAR
jgi:Zn-dependent protease with chaperone function